MRKLWLLTLAVPVLVAGCGQGGGSDNVPAGADKVNVIATNWKWTLDKKTFKVGVPIDFHLQATDGSHGFQLVGTNVSVDVYQGQSPVDKVWTPDKPGTYTIKCDVYCGSGHQDMVTAIQVTN